MLLIASQPFDLPGLILRLRSGQSETVKKSPREHEVFLTAPLFIEQFNLPLSPLFSCHGDFYILEMLNDPKVG